MICVRCARPIGPDEDPCDFHERDCAIEVTERCWCDTTQHVHRACCLKCNPPVALEGQGDLFQSEVA